VLHAHECGPDPKDQQVYCEWRSFMGGLPAGHPLTCEDSLTAVERTALAAQLAAIGWAKVEGQAGIFPPPRRKAAEKSPRMETEQSYLTRSVVCRTYFGTISEFGRSTLNILPVHFTAHRA
jgi:hypothetical protein